MLTRKKKLSKKEIKEDKLVATYYKAYGYFEENRTRILLYAGALVILIFAVIYYLDYKSETNEKAGELLSQVINLYDQGSYLEAIEGRPAENLIGLKEIVEEYGSTENGETAKIYLANAYDFLGKDEEALKYYEDYGGDIPIFEATALAGQAGYYAGKSDFEKAADLFKQASRVYENNVLNSQYMLNAAINYMNAGDEKEAEELFKLIKKDYPNSEVSNEVDKYLAQIN